MNKIIPMDTGSAATNPSTLAGWCEVMASVNPARVAAVAIDVAFVLSLASAVGLACVGMKFVHEAFKLVGPVGKTGFGL